MLLGWCGRGHGRCSWCLGDVRCRLAAAAVRIAALHSLHRRPLGLAFVLLLRPGLDVCWGLGASPSGSGCSGCGRAATGGCCVRLGLRAHGAGDLQVAACAGKQSAGVSTGGPGMVPGAALSGVSSNYHGLLMQSSKVMPWAGLCDAASQAVLRRERWAAQYRLGQEVQLTTVVLRARPALVTELLPGSGWLCLVSAPKTKQVIPAGTWSP